MELVTWNDPVTGATGRSGTRYALLRVEVDSAGGTHWIVTANEQEVCVAQSASAAVSRIEHLEALRCFLKGLAREMTGGQLLQAKAIVLEMTAATDRSLSEDDLNPLDAQKVEESRRALISLRTLIAVEQERRKTAPGRPTARLH